MACLNYIPHFESCEKQIKVAFGPVIGEVQSLLQNKGYFTFDFGMHRQLVKVYAPIPEWLHNGSIVEIEPENMSIRLIKP